MWPEREFNLFRTYHKNVSSPIDHPVSLDRYKHPAVNRSDQRYAGIRSNKT